MDVLARAIQFLEAEVAPHANRLDDDPVGLREAFRALGERGLAGLKVGATYGGPEIPEADFRSFQEAASRASGAFAFLQTQHQSAASLIGRSPNEALKREILPKMVTAERSVGVGFSQLRRPGPPITRATPSEGGYRIQGHIPWITGFGIFDSFLVGATLPSGEALFGVLPLEPGAGRLFSEPMRLCAMQGAQTVTAELDTFLPEDQVLFLKPQNWIANNDLINITLQGHFALGCAQAGLDILQANARKKGLSALVQAAEALDGELQDCREAAHRAKPSTDETTTDERLRIRAWAIDLAFRCAQAAIVSSAGAANSLDHPAQRVYREALVFSVSAQTTAIQAATLERLTRGG